MTTTLFVPLGVVVVEERGRKGLWFVWFSSPSLFKYKAAKHANSQANPLSQTRKTDRFLCVCVCHSRLNGPDGWPRKQGMPADQTDCMY